LSSPGPTLPVLAAAAAIVSYVTCLILIRFSERLGLSQPPNHRSSHDRPTPTAGGLGIVFGTALVFLRPAGMPSTLGMGIVAALAIAVLGLVDDRFGLSARSRLAVEAILVLAMLSLFGLPAGVAATMGWPLALALVLPCAVAVLWWLNLFNFMDGIDGLAAGEALFLSAATLALSWPHLGGQPALLALLVALIAASLGFLVLNRPPARIFMGDTGSLFLAMILGTIAALALGNGLLSPAQIAILPALFVADASTTLLVRLLRRQDILTAHKSHAYQILARRWDGHRPVVLAFTGLNLAVIWPAAWLAGASPSLGPALVTGLYLLLFTVCWRLGAGRR